MAAISIPSGGRKIAAALAGLALAAAAITSFVSNIAVDRQYAKLPFSEMIGQARISELRFAQMADHGAISPKLAKRMRSAAARAPLAYEPFLFGGAAGFTGSQTMGSRHDIRLLREALRRNPRSEAARYLLMRNDIARGSLKAAIRHMVILKRLDSPNIETMLVEIGKQVRTVQQVDQAVAALSDAPALIDPFVRGFTAVAKSGPAIRRLAEKLPGGDIDRATIATQLSYSLIQANDYPGARRVWLAVGSRKPEAVTDPSFVDATARPPFGWELLETPTGVAERQAGGGVFVDYYGRKPGPLLRQTLVLAPGAYTATLVYEPLSPEAGAIHLRLGCASAILIDEPLDAAAGHLTKLERRFAVPAQGCVGQTIEWVGQLQGRRAGQQIVLRRLEITARPGR